MRCKLFGQFGFFLWVFSLVISDMVFANHSNGLHLQLPGQTIDIKKNDIEDCQIFQNGPEVAFIMLRLKPVPAEHLYKLTKKDIGQPIVWIWNGRVLSMETLQSPIDTDLTVPNLTPFETDEFKRVFKISG